MSKRLKCVVVGDGQVGRTCLLISVGTGNYPKEYIPTVCDFLYLDLGVDGKHHDIDLHDTPRPNDDINRLRPLSYPNSDVILICFAVDDRDSLRNVSEIWVEEIRLHLPDVPIVLVACKTDLRQISRGCVTCEEGSKVAEDLGLYYQETSALTGIGVKACFEEVIRVAEYGREIRRRKKDWLRFFRRDKKDVPIPPVMPPPAQAPWLEIETSRFAEDWQKMLEHPKFPDVTFVLQGNLRLDAHKIMLCSASDFFCQVFRTLDWEQQAKHSKSLELFSVEDLNSGRIEGVASVYDIVKDNNDGKVIGEGQTHTMIELSADIKPKIFKRVLEFLYTGQPKLPDDPDDVDQDELNDIIRTSEIFKMPKLIEICQNYRSEQEFSNPSIGIYLNHETGRKMKELFFNKSDLADVIFKVEGQTIYAHKGVLCARCEVMSTMFGGNFKESVGILTEIEIPDTSAACFLALLEYLYTDHSPVEETDRVGLLALAHRYYKIRLINMCEIHIAKITERNVNQRIEQAEIDVIGLLLSAQAYNADQLSKWCLHFISSNYLAFKNRKEFQELKGDNKDYVEKNQWPPLSYINELEEYQEQLKKKKEDEETCRCTVM